MALKIDLEGQASRELDALIERVRDTRPLLESLGAMLADSTRLRFVDQQDPQGRPWKPLSPFTLARRRKQGRGAQILRDTGRLMGSITHAWEGDTMLIGTNVTYGRTHQLGEKRIPVRAFLGISADDERDIADEVGNYLRGA